VGVVNASPDILAQPQANPVLQPACAPRDTAIAGIVLVDAQIDHTTGCSCCASPRVRCRSGARTTPRGPHARQPDLAVLKHYCGVERQAMPIDGSHPFVSPALRDRGRAPRWRPPARAVSIASTRWRRQRGAGAAMRPEGRSLVYAPGLGAMESRLARYSSSACVLVDGTF
jgi:pyrroloquinoline quinone biosynthesis protein B